MKNRRIKKKILLVLTSLALALSFNSVELKEEEKLSVLDYTLNISEVGSGWYSGSADGAKSLITTYVHVSDNKMDQVYVAHHNERYYEESAVREAIDTVPVTVKKVNSLDPNVVGLVKGAEQTTLGILNACLNSMVYVDYTGRVEYRDPVDDIAKLPKWKEVKYDLDNIVKIVNPYDIFEIKNGEIVGFTDKAVKRDTPVSGLRLFMPTVFASSEKPVYTDLFYDYLLSNGGNLFIPKMVDENGNVVTIKKDSIRNIFGKSGDEETFVGIKTDECYDKIPDGFGGGQFSKVSELNFGSPNTVVSGQVLSDLDDSNLPSKLVIKTPTDASLETKDSVVEHAILTIKQVVENKKGAVVEVYVPKKYDGLPTKAATPVETYSLGDDKDVNWLNTGEIIDDLRKFIIDKEAFETSGLLSSILDEHTHKTTYDLTIPEEFKTDSTKFFILEDKYEDITIGSKLDLYLSEDDEDDDFINGNILEGTSEDGYDSYNEFVEFISEVIDGEVEDFSLEDLNDNYALMITVNGDIITKYSMPKFVYYADPVVDAEPFVINGSEGGEAVVTNIYGSDINLDGIELSAINDINVTIEPDGVEIIKENDYIKCTVSTDNAEAKVTIENITFDKAEKGTIVLNTGLKVVLPIIIKALEPATEVTLTTSEGLRLDTTKINVDKLDLESYEELSEYDLDDIDFYYLFSNNEVSYKQVTKPNAYVKLNENGYTGVISDSDKHAEYLNVVGITEVDDKDVVVLYANISKNEINFAKPEMNTISGDKDNTTKLYYSDTVDNVLYKLEYSANPIERGTARREIPEYVSYAKNSDIFIKTSDLNTIGISIVVLDDESQVLYYYFIKNEDLNINVNVKNVIEVEGNGTLIIPADRDDELERLVGKDKVLDLSVLDYDKADSIIDTGVIKDIIIDKDVILNEDNTSTIVGDLEYKVEVDSDGTIIKFEVGPKNATRINNLISTEGLADYTTKLSVDDTKGYVHHYEFVDSIVDLKVEELDHVYKLLVNKQTEAISSVDKTHEYLVVVSTDKDGLIREYAYIKTSDLVIRQAKRPLVETVDGSNLGETKISTSSDARLYYKFENTENKVSLGTAEDSLIDLGYTLYDNSDLLVNHADALTTGISICLIHANEGNVEFYYYISNDKLNIDADLSNYVNVENSTLTIDTTNPNYLIKKMQDSRILDLSGLSYSKSSGINDITSLEVKEIKLPNGKLINKANPVVEIGDVKHEVTFVGDYIKSYELSVIERPAVLIDPISTIEGNLPCTTIVEGLGNKFNYYYKFISTPEKQDGLMKDVIDLNEFKALDKLHQTERITSTEFRKDYLMVVGVNKDNVMQEYGYVAKADLNYIVDVESFLIYEEGTNNIIDVVDSILDEYLVLNNGTLDLSNTDFGTIDFDVTGNEKISQIILPQHVVINSTTPVLKNNKGGVIPTVLYNDKLYQVEVDNNKITSLHTRNVDVNDATDYFVVEAGVLKGLQPVFDNEMGMSFINRNVIVDKVLTLTNQIISIDLTSVDSKFHILLYTTLVANNVTKISDTYLGHANLTRVIMPNLGSENVEQPDNTNSIGDKTFTNCPDTLVIDAAMKQLPTTSHLISDKDYDGIYYSNNGSVYTYAKNKKEVGTVSFESSLPKTDGSTITITGLVEPSDKSLVRFFAENGIDASTRKYQYKFFDTLEDIPNYQNGDPLLGGYKDLTSEINGFKHITYDEGNYIQVVCTQGNYVIAKAYKQVAEFNPVTNVETFNINASQDHKLVDNRYQYGLDWNLDNYGTGINDVEYYILNGENKVSEDINVNTLTINGITYTVKNDLTESLHTLKDTPTVMDVITTSATPNNLSDLTNGELTIRVDSRTPDDGFIHAKSIDVDVNVDITEAAQASNFNLVNEPGTKSFATKLNGYTINDETILYRFVDELHTPRIGEIATLAETGLGYANEAYTMNGDIVLDETTVNQNLEIVKLDSDGAIIGYQTFIPTSVNANLVITDFVEVNNNELKLIGGVHERFNKYLNLPTTANKANVSGFTYDSINITNPELEGLKIKEFVLKDSKLVNGESNVNKRAISQNVFHKITVDDYGFIDSITSNPIVNAVDNTNDVYVFDNFALKDLDPLFAKEDNSGLEYIETKISKTNEGALTLTLPTDVTSIELVNNSRFKDLNIKILASENVTKVDANLINPYITGLDTKKLELVPNSFSGLSNLNTFYAAFNELPTSTNLFKEFSIIDTNEALGYYVYSSERTKFDKLEVVSNEPTFTGSTINVSTNGFMTFAAEKVNLDDKYFYKFYKNASDVVDFYSDDADNSYRMFRGLGATALQDVDGYYAFDNGTSTTLNYFYEEGGINKEYAKVLIVKVKGSYVVGQKVMNIAKIETQDSSKDITATSGFNIVNSNVADFNELVFDDATIKEYGSNGSGVVVNNLKPTYTLDAHTTTAVYELNDLTRTVTASGKYSNDYVADKADNNLNQTDTLTITVSSSENSSNLDRDYLLPAKKTITVKFKYKQASDLADSKAKSSVGNASFTTVLSDEELNGGKLYYRFVNEIDMFKPNNFVTLTDVNAYLDTLAVGKNTNFVEYTTEREVTNAESIQILEVLTVDSKNMVVGYQYFDPQITDEANVHKVNVKMDVVDMIEKPANNNGTIDSLKFPSSDPSTNKTELFNKYLRENGYVLDLSTYEYGNLELDVTDLSGLHISKITLADNKEVDVETPRAIAQNVFHKISLNENNTIKSITSTPIVDAVDDTNDVYTFDGTKLSDLDPLFSNVDNSGLEYIKTKIAKDNEVLRTSVNTLTLPSGVTSIELVPDSRFNEIDVVALAARDVEKISSTLTNPHIVRLETPVLLTLDDTAFDSMTNLNIFYARFNELPVNTDLFATFSLNDLAKENCLNTEAYKYTKLNLPKFNGLLINSVGTDTGSTITINNPEVFGLASYTEADLTSRYYYKVYEANETPVVYTENNRLFTETGYVPFNNEGKDLTVDAVYGDTATKIQIIKKQGSYVISSVIKDIPRILYDKKDIYGLTPTIYVYGVDNSTIGVHPRYSTRIPKPYSFDDLDNYNFTYEPETKNGMTYTMTGNYFNGKITVSGTPTGMNLIGGETFIDTIKVRVSAEQTLENHVAPRNEYITITAEYSQADLATANRGIQFLYTSRGTNFKDTILNNLPDLTTNKILYRITNNPENPYKEQVATNDFDRLRYDENPYVKNSNIKIEDSQLGDYLEMVLVDKNNLILQYRAIKLSDVIINYKLSDLVTISNGTFTGFNDSTLNYLERYLADTVDFSDWRKEPNVLFLDQVGTFKDVNIDLTNSKYDGISITKVNMLTNGFDLVDETDHVAEVIYDKDNNNTNLTYFKGTFGTDSKLDKLTTSVTDEDIYQITDNNLDGLREVFNTEDGVKYLNDNPSLIENVTFGTNVTTIDLVSGNLLDSVNIKNLTANSVTSIVDYLANESLTTLNVKALTYEGLNPNALSGVVKENITITSSLPALPKASNLVTRITSPFNKIGHVDGEVFKYGKGLDDSFNANLEFSSTAATKTGSVITVTSPNTVSSAKYYYKVNGDDITEVSIFSDLTGYNEMSTEAIDYTNAGTSVQVIEVIGDYVTAEYSKNIAVVTPTTFSTITLNGVAEKQLKPVYVEKNPDKSVIKSYKYTTTDLNKLPGLNLAIDNNSDDLTIDGNFPTGNYTQAVIHIDVEANELVNPNTYVLPRVIEIYVALYLKNQEATEKDIISSAATEVVKQSNLTVASVETSGNKVYYKFVDKAFTGTPIKDVLATQDGFSLTLNVGANNLDLSSHFKDDIIIVETDKDGYIINYQRLSVVSLNYLPDVFSYGTFAEGKSLATFINEKGIRNVNFFLGKPYKFDNSVLGTDDNSGTIYMVYDTSLNIYSGNETKPIKVNTLEGMLHGCKSLEGFRLESGDVVTIDATEATSAKWMLAHTEALNCVINLNGIKTSNKLTNLEGVFYVESGKGNALTEINLGDNFDISGVTTFDDMFQNRAGLQRINFNYTNNVNLQANVDLDLMFSGCANLYSLDLSKFVVPSENTITTSNMFDGSTFINPNETLTLNDGLKSVLRTNNNSNIHVTYIATNVLDNVPFKNFVNSSGATSLYFVNAIGPQNKTYLPDLSGYTYHKEGTKLTIYSESTNKQSINLPVDCSGMFKCPALEYIDFGSNIVDASNVRKVTDMFHNDSKLTTIKNFGNLDLSKVENSNGMFAGCTALTYINIKKLNTTDTNKNYEWMFNACSSLKDVYMTSGKQSEKDHSQYADKNQWNNPKIMDNGTLVQSGNGITYVWNDEKGDCASKLTDISFSHFTSDNRSLAKYLVDYNGGGSKSINRVRFVSRETYINNCNNQLTNIPLSTNNSKFIAAGYRKEKNPYSNVFDTTVLYIYPKYSGKLILPKDCSNIFNFDGAGHIPYLAGLTEIFITESEVNASRVENITNMMYGKFLVINDLNLSAFKNCNATDKTLNINCGPNFQYTDLGGLTLIR